jgi:hypothetical protein
MHSRFITFLFAFLLLGMQHEAHVHALTHFGDQAQQPHEQTAQLPTDDTTCAVCALFAGGASALASDGATLDASRDSFVAPIDAERSAAQSPPAFYLSRAPPPLLL